MPSPGDGGHAQGSSKMTIEKILLVDDSKTELH
jgi:hypothetical protein